MFGNEGGEFPRNVKPLEGLHVAVSELDLTKYSPTDLFTLRNLIDGLLPPMTMAEIDLEEETVRQFMTVKTLQGTTLAGNDEPNKKASVVNACAAALQQLAKLQTDIHTAERFKRIENLLIKHLKLLPEETARAFLADYSNLILSLESK